MFLFKRLSSFYEPPTGLIKDPRTVEEKEKDFLADEILSFAPVKWTEKPRNQWRRFEIFDQGQSSSCVGQTIAKLMGIDNFLEEGKWVRYSARDLYSQRKNKPNPGAWAQDIAHIAYKKGASLEQLMPSEKRNEEQMNDDSDGKTIDEQIALVGKAGGYVSFEFSFDKVASVIEQTKKGVAISCWFNPGDWNSAIVQTRKNGVYGHLVAVVDYTLYQGRKALIFDNSWGSSWGFGGQGVLLEGNHEGVRNFALYLQDLKNTWRDEEKQIIKPRANFQRDLIFGMRNVDVIVLQECLKYEELFPINTLSTGFYGNITAKAVLEFQKKYGLPFTDGRKVDKITRDKLNELYK